MTLAIDIAVVQDHADPLQLFMMLKCEGHRVSGFACTEDLNDFLISQSVDLLLLDLNLSGENKYEFARRVRDSHPDLYIVMMTARTALEDRIRGYASGADLYFIKPVVPDELVAAVGNIARRVHGSRARQMKLVLSLPQLELAGPAGVIALTQPEAALLKILAEARDRKLDYWRLFELLQIQSQGKNSKNVLEARVSRLKKKLHDIGAPEPAIRALWKEGYQLCVSVKLLS